jgi:integrase
VLTEPKTDRSRRRVPLHAGAVTALKAHRKQQLQEPLAAGDQWTDTNDVFVTEFGTMLEPRNLLRTVEIAAKKAGIADVGAHTMRHSATVAWLESGVHIKAAADLLGHSSIAITGDLYGHTSDDTARAAVDGLGKTLGL